MIITRTNAGNPTQGEPLFSALGKRGRGIGRSLFLYVLGFMAGLAAGGLMDLIQRKIRGKLKKNSDQRASAYTKTIFKPAR